MAGSKQDFIAYYRPRATKHWLLERLGDFKGEYTYMVDFHAISEGETNALFAHTEPLKNLLLKDTNGWGVSSFP